MLSTVGGGRRAGERHKAGQTAREGRKGSAEEEGKGAEAERDKTNKLTSELVVYCWVGTR